MYCYCIIRIHNTSMIYQVHSKYIYLALYHVILILHSIRIYMTRIICFPTYDIYGDLDIRLVHAPLSGILVYIYVIMITIGSNLDGRRDVRTLLAVQNEQGNHT